MERLSIFFNKQNRISSKTFDIQDRDKKYIKKLQKKTDGLI